MECFFVIKTRLILEKRGRVLLLAQTNSNGGKYTLVGGKVESTEFAKETLVRECKEEIGIQINPDDLKLVYVLHKKKPKESRLTLYFTTQTWNGKVLSREPHKFRGVAWFPKNDLPARTSPTVRHVLKRYNQGIAYSEFRK